MTARLPIVLAAALAACGPRATGGDAPGAPARRAALVVVAPDAATLDRTIEVLSPVGGDGLATARFAVPAPGADAAWPASTFSARGLAADAPLGVAITADGVVVRWAAVADAGRLRTAIGAMPGAARWQADGGELWKIGDAAIVVIARDRVGVVSAGAGSSRERTALELASGALDAGAAPHPGGLALEIDGGFLVGTFAPAPGPVLTGLGSDLGRIRAGLVASPEEVSVELVVHPVTNTLADEVLAGAHGANMMTPHGVFALATRIRPARALELLTELGARAGIDVPGAVQSTKLGAAAITGAVALAPGAVGIRFADVGTMALITSLLPRHTLDRDYGNDSASFGAHGSAGAGGGLNLQPQAFAVAPPYPPDPPELGELADDNTDVPWSQDYRAARTAFEAAQREVARVLVLREGALRAFENDRGLALGRAIALPMVPIEGGYRARGTWNPPRGTIAASVEAANAAFKAIDKHDVDVDRAHAAAIAARQRALEVRAADVQAWDKGAR